MKEKEMVGGCCVCSDDRGWDENPLVYCDGQGCSVAVHQACYGIVSVPSGPWFCRKCESQERSARVKCDLCPLRDGALKRTDQDGWAHVVCALYIPEVRFGNVSTMEPILVSLIPPERFNKTCYICEESNRTSKAGVGACMSCNKTGCKQNFHVTCGQLLGLLCEEAGALLDNVKYCGYCQYHSGKLKSNRHTKIIPPYRPVSGESPSPDKSSSHSNHYHHQSHHHLHHSHGSKTNDDSKAQPGNSSNSNSKMKGSSSSTSSSSSSVSNNSSKVTTTSSSNPNPNNNVSPDIIKSKVSSKRGGSYNGSSSSAISNAVSSASHQESSRRNSSSPIPRIAPSNLFSSGAFASSLNNENSEDKSAAKLKSPASVSVSLERIDEKRGNSNSSSNSGGMSSNSYSSSHHHRKDDLVTSSSTVSNDRTSSGSGGSKKNDYATEKEGLAAKLPPPPDIKPHVTLTPIPPVRTPTSGDHGTKGEKGYPASCSSNGSSCSTTSSTSYGGPPTLQNQRKEISPDVLEIPAKGGKGPPELTLAEFEKNGVPPSKRSRIDGDASSRMDSSTPIENSRKGDSFSQQTPPSSEKVSPSSGLWDTPTSTNAVNGRDNEVIIFASEDSGRNDSLKPTKRGPGRPPRRSGPSREDEKERERRTPTKGRGGRRGGANNGYQRKETPPRVGNGGIDDGSPFDDPMDGGFSNDVRGSNKLGPGNSRKSDTNRSSNRREDSPTPTLSQLKSMKESSGGPDPEVAPHMFGNALNPASSMAQHMVNTLSQEIEAHSCATGGSVAEPGLASPNPVVVGIPFPGRLGSSLPTTENSSHSIAPQTSSGGAPTTLEQLLELQWEQGSQFLMEQAQHLDIAQLLSCLNQLKQDNIALEEHVKNLAQRKDHLVAINARLSVPLGTTLSSLVPGHGNNNANGRGRSHSPPPPPHNMITHHAVTATRAANSSSNSPLPPHHHHENMMGHPPQQPHGRPQPSNMYGHGQPLDVHMARELSVTHRTHSPHGGPPSGHHGGRNLHPSPMNSPYGGYGGQGNSSGHHPNMPRDSR